MLHSAICTLIACQLLRRGGGIRVEACSSMLQFFNRSTSSIAALVYVFNVALFVPILQGSELMQGVVMNVLTFQ